MISFFILVLFAMLIILFVVFRGSSYSNSKPFAASCFFTMVLSILFRTMGFIQNKWMYIFITIMAGSAVAMGSTPLVYKPLPGGQGTKASQTVSLI